MTPANGSMSETTRLGTPGRAAGTGPLTLPPPLRRLVFLAATALFLMLTGPVRAEDEADLDLKPADFLPDEPIALRVDDLHAGDKGSEVEVTVLNRAGKTVSAAIDCILYDDDREELGTATGAVAGVAPGERAKATLASAAEGASRAYCQVKESR